MSEGAIPKTVTARLLRRAGAQRVSADAKTAVAAILEQYAANLSKEALKIAQMEGRTTVRAEDIKRAHQAIPSTNG